MAKKRHGAEQIISKLREAEVELAKGRNVAQVCKKLAVAEQTYYRWRKEYGGLRCYPPQHSGVLCASSHLLSGDGPRFKRGPVGLAWSCRFGPVSHVRMIES